MKIPTKVPLLDDMLSGGIVRGSSTLLWCAPFVNGSVLTYQICNNWLEQKGTIIYMVNNKRPDIVIEDAMKYGWEFKSHINEGNFAFIDAYTGIMGIQSNEKYVVSDPLNINEVRETVINAIKEVKGKNALITIDSLSTMIDHFGDEVLSCISDWNKIAFLNDVSMFYIFSEWNYERELKDKIALPEVIGTDESSVVAAEPKTEVEKEAILALVSLGYTRGQATKAVAKVQKIHFSEKAEEIIKRALQVI